MKTTRYTCSTGAGGMVPVVHDVDELHVAHCRPVETKTVGTSRYVLSVTNAANPGSSLYWTDDEGFPLVEDGELILWSV